MRTKYLTATMLILSLGYNVMAGNKSQLMDSLLYWSGKPDSELKIDKLNDFSFQLIFYEMDSAAFYAELSRRISEQLKYPKGMMHANNNLSLIFINQMKYKSAISHAYNAINKAWELKDYDFVAYQNVQLALIYRYIGAYEDAVRFYERSISLQDSLKDFKPLFFAKRGLGLTYRETEDFHQSNQIFLELIRICEQHKDEIKKGILINDIGRNYLLNKQFEIALHYFRQSLQIKRENNDPRLRMALRDIGETFAVIDQYDSAFYYLYASLDLCQKQNYSFGTMATHTQLSNIYYKLKKFDSALLNADKALVYAKQLNLKDHKRDMYKKLADIYHMKGNIGEAFRVLGLYNQLNDSLNHLESRNLIETYVTLEKQENELNIQQANLKMLTKSKATETKFKWALLGLVVMMGVTLSLLYQRYKSKYNSELLLSQKNQEIAKKNNEISQMNQMLENRLFRLQMDPHFIFNSLSAIQHFITVSDQDAALTYLTKFSRLIRQILENSSCNKVPVVEELNLLEHYLELESLRFNHSFEYDIIVKQDVDIYNLEVPFLLIQPFVENAINHGLKGVKNGRLTVLVSCNNEFVEFIIEDNGIGREKAEILKKSGQYKPMGMSINYQRLERLGTVQYKSACVNVIDLKDEQNQAYGTRVEIKLPISF